MNPAFTTVIAASDAERRDLFLATAARLGTAVQNVEKDFYALAIDCAHHARLFFGGADLGLDTAAPGTFTLTPSPAMRDELARDYEAMAGMVFGAIPPLDDVLASAGRFEQLVNHSEAASPQGSASPRPT